eukprot:3321407-Pyramimonas_sp.AAC.1
MDGHAQRRLGHHPGCGGHAAGLPHRRPWLVVSRHRRAGRQRGEGVLERLNAGNPTPQRRPPLTGAGGPSGQACSPPGARARAL